MSRLVAPGLNSRAFLFGFPPSPLDSWWRPVHRAGFAGAIRAGLYSSPAGPTYLPPWLRPITATTLRRGVSIEDAMSHYDWMERRYLRVTYYVLLAIVLVVFAAISVAVAP